MKNQIMLLAKSLRWAVALLLITSTVFAQTDNASEVFTSVEESPRFPGGIEKFYAFVGKNVTYPAKARQEKIQGKVIATFIVEKDGSLSNIKVLRSPSEDLATEAQRVLSQSPKWLPGKQNDHVVRVQYTLPVMFSLDKQITIKANDTANDTTNTGASLRIKALDTPDVLYMIDGKEATQETFKSLNPNNIKSINVLKDSSATQKYGTKGAKGVIEVEMKAKP